MAGTSAALPSSLLSTNDDGACIEVILFSCTRGETRVCHLLNNLTYFNDVLWNVGLQLREVDAGKRLGDLVVATVPGSCGDFPHCDACAHNEELPVSYLRCLLRAHRCIVSAEMNFGVANSAMVIEALESSSSLRRLTVRGTELEDEEQAHPCWFEHVSSSCLAAGYILPDDSLNVTIIPRMLQRCSGATLTSLDVTNVVMDQPSGVDMFITTHYGERHDHRIGRRARCLCLEPPDTPRTSSRSSDTLRRKIPRLKCSL
ncbi:hypothetical protein MTO96_026454 [Rhipicephalus appendiculatus]